MGEGSVPAPCRAPWTSMHLDPRGNVRACEVNSLHLLGNITQSGLAEIWHGTRAERLRSALADHDFGLGCEGCAWPMQAGTPELAHAREYDRLVPASDGLGWPTQLELSLTNTCNLQCIQCTGELSSAIRRQREHLPPLPQVYDDAFFADLEPFLAHLERVVFIGGEPFLGREPMRVVELLAAGSSRPRCVVSTNGTVWNDRVEQMLDTFPVDVSVSMDGASAEVFERIRLGARFDDVVANLDRFRASAARRGTAVNLNHCLMVDNVGSFAEFLRFADDRDLDVHINTVTHPPSLSLYRLGASALAERLQEMDDAGARVGPLGRNAPVWEVQRSRLHQHLASIDEAEVGVGVARPSVSAAEVDQRGHEVALRLGDGAPVSTIEMIGSEIVAGVHPDPSDVVGMDLRPLVGAHISQLMHIISSTFGELEGTELDHLEHGIEQRTLRLNGPEGRVEVWGVLVAGGHEGNDRWYLTGRRAGAVTG